MSLVFKHILHASKHGVIVNLALVHGMHALLGHIVAAIEHLTNVERSCLD